MSTPATTNRLPLYSLLASNAVSAVGNSLTIVALPLSLIHISEPTRPY